MTNNFRGLTPYELAAFEAVVYAPGTVHTGQVVSTLLKRGVIFTDQHGNHHPYTDAKNEWLEWCCRDLEVDSNGQPYDGVRVA